MPATPPRRSPALEWAALGLLTSGVILLALGAASRFALGGVAPSLLMAGGMALAAIGVSYGWNIDRLPFVQPVSGARVSGLRTWQTLKVLALLLNLLQLLALIVLVGAVLMRAGVLGATLDAGAIARIAGALAFITTAVAIASFVWAIRADLEPDRSKPIVVGHLFAVVLAILAAAFAAVVGSFGSADAVADAALAILLASALVSLDVMITRAVPNAYNLLAQAVKRYKGPTQFTASKAVVLPLVIAVGLLLITFLGLLAFETGARRAVDSARASPLLIGVSVFVVIAVIAVVVVARRLAKQEDKPELYKAPRSAEETRGRILLGASLTMAALGGIFAAVVMTGSFGNIPPGRWADVVAATLLLGLGPYGFYIAWERKRIRLLEARFPDFLRDIAASHRGGLTLRDAVTVASRGEYGTLSPYVQRMADQMSWNIPFAEALQWLSDQVRTPLVQRAVDLILEADRSGGGTADVLMAAARDAREIKKLETDRNISMSLYTVVIYITFGVFLLVAAVLYGQFVPQLLAAQDAAASGGGAVSSSDFAPAGSRGDISLSDYRAFYYIAALVQGVGGGIVAGIMATGRASLGLRHAFVMTALSFVTFSFVLT